MVFKQNSVADKFYIILSGSVYVMKLSEASEENKEPNPEFKERYKRDPFFYDQRTKLFKQTVVKVLDQNTVFGEVGIITGQYRMASIIC